MATTIRQDTSDEGWIVRENPARPSQIVGRIAVTPPRDIARIVAAASKAQAEWAELELEQRIALFERAIEDVSSLETLSCEMTQEMGKPLLECTGELHFALALALDMARRARRLLPDETRGKGAGRRVVRRAPFGVVAAIVPWNAPIILAMTKIAPALLSGNAIVIKPSPLAPLGLTNLVSAIAGKLPRGLISVVNGGAETGNALLSAPEVTKVAFTGGTEVGRMVLRAAAERFVPCTLELGGNDPLIVMPGLDLTPKTMEAIVWGSFLNTGQVCMAAKRLLVHEAMMADFVDAYVETARSVFRVGSPIDPMTNMGPMITRAAQQRIDALAIDSARQGGTVIPLLDQALPDCGYFARPRLVTGLSPDARLVCEEQFGPIVPILGWQSEDEVIALANAHDSLSASAWSGDTSGAWSLASRTKAGLRLVNAHNRSGFSFDLPFGGSGRAGYGREYGDEGLLEYTQAVAMHQPPASEAAQSYPGAA